MSNEIPTNYSDKTTAVGADSCFGFDSVAVDNKNITVQAIGDFAMSDNDTDALSEGSTNLYYTDTRVDTRNAATGVPINTTTDVSSNAWVLDEDNMASDSNTKVPTQQSVKFYVDNNGVPIDSLTEDTAPDMDADFNIEYDNSAAINKKYKMSSYRATIAEVAAGVSTTKFITPKQLQDNILGNGVQASDVLVLSADTQREQEGTTYVKHKEMVMGNYALGGPIRIKFDMKNIDGAETAFGRIYINGVATGTEQTTSSTSFVTFSQDITVSTKDLIQLFIKNSTSASGPGAGAVIENFRIHYDVVILPRTPTVNLD